MISLILSSIVKSVFSESKVREKKFSYFSVIKENPEIWKLRKEQKLRVRNKQLPPCPSRVKFVGGNLALLEGCPQDNLKFSNKF